MSAGGAAPNGRPRANAASAFSPGTFGKVLRLAVWTSETLLVMDQSPVLVDRSLPRPGTTASARSANGLVVRRHAFEEARLELLALRP